jgi:hypothetical protein
MGGLVQSLGAYCLSFFRDELFDFSPSYFYMIFHSILHARDSG